jgi:chromosome segregation ATPase
MPLLSRFKRGAGQDGVGSLATGAENDALVKDFLNIIETQTTQINILTHELKLKESALDDCLGQENIPQLNTASQGNELQRKTQEVDQLKNELRKQDRLLQSYMQNAEQELKKARMDFDKYVQSSEQELQELKEERMNFDKELSQQQEQLSRARHEAETLGEQLDLKGQRIHELGEQVQTQTEIIEQTRLALNRTRNELARPARQ